MDVNKYHGNYNRSKRTGSPKYICVHYTGTQASAKNNCIYFAGGDRQASADYFIDDTGIWEYNDPSSSYYTWAVGDGAGKYGITNNNSISIEVVSDGRDFSEAEINYLTELVHDLMARFGIPVSRVVRHYDASRKRCPAPYIAEAKWQALKAHITAGDSATWMWDDKGGWWYRHADGSYTTNGWESINGSWYYFDKQGYMHTGWVQDGGKWYFCLDSGAMVANGWAWVGGKCYCFDASGALRTGWIQEGSKWYYCNPDGDMARNIWHWDDTYTGWFYFNNDGSMATNTWIDNYHVNASGYWDMSR